ncbi:hypothetical protein F4780DRAFT_740605 [Xylariomycetidae sp. FL0641]|nr:hypothetical protein F4780DRAFT_740605 [Xylariomycetidae sp. FL0641]
MELHIWGPAFGLQSIDPECLAAVALLRYTLRPGSWTLIASNDVAVSPDNILPALCHNGTWTSGYLNIVQYIRESTGIENDSPVDDDLTPEQRADLLAYSSYITTRGSGLLALSLYASPSAWTKLTRPAYSDLLPFPLTWTVPPGLRAAAVEKADHLGMGYLASEVDAEEEAARGAVEANSTGFLRLRQTLGPSKSLQPEQMAVIRFQHLAEDFYSTIDGLRGNGKTFILHDARPTSLDFLVYAYVSLMRVQTPHPIMKSVLEKQYPQLLEVLGAVDASVKDRALPWKQAPPRGALGLAGSFADGVVESIPGLGESWGRWRRGGIRDSGSEDVKDPAQMLLMTGGTVVGLAAVGVAVLLKSISPLGASTHTFERPKTGLQRFGEFGAMLDGLPIWEEPQMQQTPVRDTVYHKGDVDVAVDVDPALA